MPKSVQLNRDCVLYCGDNADALATMADNSLDSCVTDPPYHLTSIVKRFGATSENDDTQTSERVRGRVDGYARLTATGFMGRTWDGGDIAFRVAFWREVFRVLKPGAFLCAFGASRGYHRMACAIEDAGFEVRDSLMWIYGTGFPKSHDVAKGIDRERGERGERGAAKLLPNGREHHFNIGFGEGEGFDARKAERYGYIPATPQAAEWDGWGTALKPAFEPIVLARKPLSEPTVAANVLRWRTGALNIDGCRIGTEDTRRESYKLTSKGIKGGGYASGQMDTERNGVMAGSASGRWPANVVTDGSPEVVGLFPSTAPSKRKGDEPHEYQPNAKNAVYGHNMGGGYHAGFDDRGNGSAARFFYSAKASKQDRAGSKHPTVKPVSLMRWLCRLATPPGGTVLDPFAGSGTTGAAAMQEGFRAVLCEREAEYVADIKRRFGAGFVDLATAIRAHEHRQKIATRLQFAVDSLRR